MATCSQKINFVDKTPPTLNCPADIVLNCGQEPTPSVTGNANATDNCSPEESISITFTDSYQDNTLCVGALSIKRTWRAVDICGNATTCVQNIVFDDNEPPVLQCPADITLECGENSGPGNTGRPSVNDNCSSNNQIQLTYTDNSAGAAGCSEGSRIERTWLATDACGNTASCVQTIFLAPDNQPPVINCPEVLELDCDDDTAPASTGYPSISDNCTRTADIILTYTDDRSDANGCDGVIVRTWTATDQCNNQSQCDQIIRLVDDEDPDLSCPKDLNIKCDEPSDPSNTGYPEVADNCTAAASLDVTYFDEDNGKVDCKGKGRIYRTWTVTDECGNSSSCEQTIKVKKSNDKDAFDEEILFANQFDDPEVQVQKEQASSNSEDQDVDSSKAIAEVNDRIVPGTNERNNRLYVEAMTGELLPYFVLDLSLRKQIKFLGGIPNIGLGLFIPTYRIGQYLSNDQFRQYLSLSEGAVPYFSLGAAYKISDSFYINGDLRFLTNFNYFTTGNYIVTPAVFFGVGYRIRTR
jgi:hypothetical protein